MADKKSSLVKIAQAVLDIPNQAIKVVGESFSVSGDVVPEPG